MRTPKPPNFAIVCLHRLQASNAKSPTLSEMNIALDALFLFCFNRESRGFGAQVSKPLAGMAPTHYHPAEASSTSPARNARSPKALHSSTASERLGCRVQLVMLKSCQNPSLWRVIDEAENLFGDQELQGIQRMVSLSLTSACHAYAIGTVHFRILQILSDHVNVGLSENGGCTQS